MLPVLAVIVKLTDFMILGMLTIHSHIVFGGMSV